MGPLRGRLLSEVRRDEVAVCEIEYAEGSVLSEHRHDGAYVSVVADGFLPRRIRAAALE